MSPMILAAESEATALTSFMRSPRNPTQELKFSEYVRLELGQIIGYRLRIDPLGDFFVSGLRDHRGQSPLELLQSPADRVFYAFLFHMMDRMFAGTDMIMRIFVKAVEAQDCFPFVVCACPNSSTTLMISRSPDSFFSLYRPTFSFYR